MAEGIKLDRKLVVVIGPTAVGKSALALSLAQQFGGEIVSADSRQVYRHMDIGTDKPSAEARRLVPHHLVDVVGPGEEFTLAMYQDSAYHAIDDIISRGRLPLLVGGTALYVEAVTEGWRIPRVQPDPELRERLQTEAEAQGTEALYARLASVDPDAASKINPANLRRIIRALEVFETTGQPISSLQGMKRPDYHLLKIGLTTDREDLYRRIDERYDRMIEEGLVEEVQSLMEQGYGLDLPSMSGLGYRQIGRYVAGEYSLPEAVERLKFDTHRFVRHQYTWFRRDQEIQWFDVRSEACYSQLIDTVESFLRQE
jgi:tRNA dimethylallyltransferase